MKKFLLIAMLFCVSIGVWFVEKPANQAAGKCPVLQQDEKAGCCSRHRGVCGCNKDFHKQKCCDGTLSPSCGC